MSLEAEIRAGLASLGLARDESRVARLAAFLRLLERWNRVYNLTAVRQPAEMVGRHLLDSLSVVSAIRGPCTLDVGSGAGLPGVPLAVVLSRVRFVLLDSSAKRTRFLRQVQLELDLDNVTVARARIQDYDPGFRFDTIVARAFSSLHDFVENAGRLCQPGGHLLAMKGRFDPREGEDLPPGWHLEEVRRLQVPQLPSNRHLIKLAQQAGAKGRG